MSSLLNQSLNGSNSNLPDSTARPFTSSFTAQSAAASPAFHHSGTMQGLHNMHGNFSVPNMPGNLTSRNSAINGAPSNGGVQQPIGSLSSGRFTSNNIPVALSQMSHASSHGHSGITNRGGMNIVGSTQYSGSMNGVSGSIPGIPPSSTAVNRSAVPGLVSPMMGNAGARITNSMGNIVGGGNIGRNINSGGGLSVSGLASRLNLAGNSGSGSLSAQGPNRLMGATPQVMSMLNSYPSGGGQLSQSQVQASNNLSSMGMLNDMNSNDNSPFDINDFPQLNGRPSSAGGPQGQMGSMRKQSVGVSPIVQQNQEFSIQNEDFPALPGFKGGNADYGMDMHQKEQYHDNSVSMMQSQHFPMGRSAGFNFAGSYSSQRAQQQQQQQQQQLQQQQQQQQQLHAPSVSSSGMSFTSTNNQDLHLHGSDLFPSSHATYHSQTSGSPSIGLRQLNSQNSLSGIGSYDHLIQLQQYQQQNQSQFRLQQMSAVNQSYRDHNLKSMQMAQASPDRYGLLGLLNVIRMSDPDLTSLALGIDLTTLGLNLNSTENLHKAFGSPWSDEPAKGEPEFAVPECYYSKQPPVLHQGYFSKFQSETLFYIFYSMPRDEAQLYAANELYNRGWFYHKELKAWLVRAPNMEPLVKTNTYERGSYLYFDSNTWETIRKDNFVLYYELLEQRPPMAPSH